MSRRQCAQHLCASHCKRGSRTPQYLHLCFGWLYVGTVDARQALLPAVWQKHRMVVCQVLDSTRWLAAWIFRAGSSPASSSVLLTFAGSGVAPLPLGRLLHLLWVKCCTSDIFHSSYWLMHISLAHGLRSGVCCLCGCVFLIGGCDVRMTDLRFHVDPCRVVPLAVAVGRGCDHSCCFSGCAATW